MSIGWDEKWNAYFTVIFSELNGVGGRITLVKIEVFIGSDCCASNTESGGRFGANGTLEVSCDIRVPSHYEFDEMVIRAEGVDDNDFDITASKQLYYSWDGNKLRLFQ